MAIRAQQFDVALIGRPVFEAAAPGVPGLRSDLGLRVDVIDVECPVITEATANTFPAELRNERQLALPIARMFVDGCAVLIPETLLALWRAELRRTLPTALSAFAVSAPTRSQVASLTAVFPGAALEAINMHLKRLAAVLAMASDARLFHGRSIAKYHYRNNRRYFDMFVAPPAKPVQEALV
jgi:hypothetical protein